MYSKLNLGCGDKTDINYLNVDLNRGEGVDLIADIRYLTFKPDCLQEILLQDVLEHFSLNTSKTILHNCYSWLKPDGVIKVYVPNIRILAYNLSVRDCSESLKWLYGSDGSNNGGESTFHRWAYSTQSLTKLLNEVGFKVTKSNMDCYRYRIRVTAKK